MTSAAAALADSGGDSRKPCMRSTPASATSFKLGRRFNSLCDHRQSCRMRQVGHGAEKARYLGIAASGLQETAIELDDIDRQPAQVGQGRLPHAEIIQRHATPYARTAVTAWAAATSARTLSVISRQSDVGGKPAVSSIPASPGLKPGCPSCCWEMFTDSRNSRWGQSWRTCWPCRNASVRIQSPSKA